MVQMEKLKSREAKITCNHYLLPPQMTSFDNQIKVGIGSLRLTYSEHNR